MPDALLGGAAEELDGLFRGHVAGGQDHAAVRDDV